MRPPTVVNKPPLNLLPPDNIGATDTALACLASATRQCLQLTAKPFTLHKLSEFEPYTPSPIDRDDFLEDEPLFATDLSAFGVSLTIYHFSSAHLANLNRQDIIAGQYGCAPADIASSERTKSFNHGKRFKRSVDESAIENEREQDREAKCLEREAEWQRELATWPQFVACKGDLKKDFCPHHVWSKSYCQACAYGFGEPAPRVVDYLATLESPRVCKHPFLKSFTFSSHAGDKTIKMCPDCTKFDEERIAILKEGKIKQVRSLQWEEKLEAEGFLQKLPQNPIVSTYSSVKMDKIEHAQATNGTASSVKNDYRASQIRKEVKTNTDAQRNCEGCGVLFVPNHSSRKHCSDNCRKRHFKKKQGRAFPRTCVSKNFCPRCSTYATVDHECEGKEVERNIEMRNKELIRQKRDAAITLSDPAALAPSRILLKKGWLWKELKA